MSIKPNLVPENFLPIDVTESAEAISRPSTTYWRDAWVRFKKNRLAVTGLIVLLIMVLFAYAIGPAISSSQGNTYRYQDWSHKNEVPNDQFWLGTDNLGRDMLTRLWYGTRISLMIGLISALIDMIIGTIYGGISGYFGGVVDDIMMRIVDILFGIPYLIIVILLVVVMEQGIWSIIIALGIAGWAGMARLVRGQVLQIKELDYVLAAQALGASSPHIIWKHLFPNVLGVILVQLTLTVPNAIFAEAFLSFIGLGVPMPQASLGTLVNDAYIYLQLYPYQLFFPAIAISVIMLGFNFLGDGLRDAFDPRQKQ